MGGVTAAVVIEIVANPYAYCGRCTSELHYRADGRNMPCGCAATVGSVCPTWDAFKGCQCTAEQRMHLQEIADAEALQDALEDEERLLVGGPGGRSIPTITLAADVRIDQLARVVIRTAAAPITRVPDLCETTPGADPLSRGEDTIRQASDLQIAVIIVLTFVVLIGISAVMVLIG